MTSTGKKKKEQRSRRIYLHPNRRIKMKIGTEERRRRQKKNVRHQINTTIKKQQLAREKGKNRDHKEYINLQSNEESK